MTRDTSKLLKVVLLACAPLLPAAAAIAGAADEHPVLGVWQFTLPDGHCSETYHFRADGTLFVTSGEEVAESTFQVSPRPSERGFYKMVDVVTRDNGKKDCGGNVTEPGQKATNYLRLHPSGDMMLMCADESLNACFGPLRRLPAQDV